MPTLKGKDIYLRALEPEDLDFLYEVENNESIWELSTTIVPYSKYVLKQCEKRESSSTDARILYSFSVRV